MFFLLPCGSHHHRALFFFSIALPCASQMSALLSGLGGEGEYSGGGGSRGDHAGSSSSSSRELADIRAVLETATAALEEIRNQVRK